MQRPVLNQVSPFLASWFKLTHENADLAEQSSVAEWLYQVEKVIGYMLARSNAYDALHEVYLEQMVFGTGACMVLPDVEDGIRLRTLTYGEYMLGEDARRKTNRLMRQFWMSAGQMKEEFGEENLSDKVKQQLENGHPEERFKLRMLIEPNDEEVPEALDRPFRALYWEEGASDELLAIRGFDYFPAITTTWERVGGQIYGIGPGHMNARNARRLQRLEEDSLQQLALNSRPPMITDAANSTTMVNAGPWQITRAQGIAGGPPGIAPLYQVNMNTTELQGKIEETVRKIEEGFFNHIFLMLANATDQDLTATQVGHMMEEKYAVLGPVIERSQGMLDHLIDIIFDYAVRFELIPEAPELIQGEPIKVEYISMLAKAQQMAGLDAVRQTLHFAGEAAGIWPEVRYKLNVGEAVDQFAQIQGVSPKILHSEEEVAAKVAAEQQQQQAQAAGEAALQATQGAKNLKEVTVGGEPLLDQIVGAG